MSTVSAVGDHTSASLFDEPLEVWRDIRDWLVSLPTDELTAILRITCDVSRASCTPSVEHTQLEWLLDDTTRAAAAREILTELVRGQIRHPA